ncbi:MAG: phosphoribosylaminoimidazolesuccinocarboxamide synthase [Nanoarchaeota archaeon]|nr:phosphoribosylaminoimidazolesuccinocarboxamide synthase [Nanoarchaeota archaeon]
MTRGVFFIDKMGSVKDLTITTEPTEAYFGEGIFEFSDRFSVFDWGAMPDEIPHKGAALCMMAAWNFEELEKRGIPTHYFGVESGWQGAITTEDLDKPSDAMVVMIANVYRPEFIDGKWNYDRFGGIKGRSGNFVVPLEVIYRNGAPKGSSLFRKIDKFRDKGDEEGLEKLLTSLGLSDVPEPGDMFPERVYDFTTKFEKIDRPVSDKEAFYMSGLTEDQFERLIGMRRSVADFIGSRAGEVGLVDYDGKFEFIIDDGEIRLADVAGTPDENRFMLNGRQVSKEFLRQVYKSTQPAWYVAVERAKEEAESRGIKNWKSLVSSQPAHLDPRLVELVGEMYASVSDRYTGLNLFDVRPLEEVMDDLEPFRAVA